MTIRLRLFIFIPLLVLLMSFVSYFLFESSRSAQESYHLFMNRILLYKQVSRESKEVMQDLNRYVIQVSAESYPDLVFHLNSLHHLQDELYRLEKNETNAIAIGNYINLMGTFMEQAWNMAEDTETQEPKSKASAYLQADQLSRFISEEGQAMVDLELENYRPLYEKLMKITEDMNRLGVYLVITVALLSILFSLWLSSSISRPILQLVLTAKQISRGNLDTKAPELQTGNEIGILCRTFNHMIDNIQELMVKNLESLKKERMVKELELKMLQSQINPHFLFNTLNVIAKMAYIEGAEKTSDLTVSVSRLLRYNLQKLDHPVTLREEVFHAEEYMAIQKERFGDRIRFITEIDEEALGWWTPCLTLQPLLENAIVHGIEHLEEGAVLRLSIRRKEDRACIEVADNGAGMDPEIRDRLIRSAREDVQHPFSGKGKSSGLGTANVFKRLHLFYDGSQTIEIRSGIGEGTTVRLTFPSSARAEETEWRCHGV
ncbi:sensor histidine kinase [Paenibacillus sp. S-38]|uniref:sensor histidine kinase n=1 Tax=Paenibacillus sp. S-38 TaxID=3416710 RepID=UPI003CED2B8D